MNNSSIQTTSKNLFEIIRFTADEIEQDLQISFSEDKKVIFDVRNKQIIIQEGETSSTYDAKEMNLSYVKGKRFEIVIQNDLVSVAYKNFYDPVDKLAVPLIKHILASPLSKDNIILSATAKAAIDDLYLFSLDNSKECISLNYEDDPNNAQVWIVKPDYDPSKVYNPDKETEEEEKEQKGCKSSLNYQITSVLFILLGLLVSLKRKKEEK